LDDFAEIWVSALIDDGAPEYEIVFTPDEVH